MTAPVPRTVASTALFALLSLGAVLTNSRGVWIADARLELSTDPAGFLAGHAHLWDPNRGMGDTATFYSPVVAAFSSAFQAVGLAPWVIERLVHAGLLTLAASGIVALVRTTMPTIGAAHVLAGLLYAFNPYTSQFLVPSGLFLSYALAPWLLTMALRGVSGSDDRWRTAAWFALCIFAVGALNPAALLYALLPVPIGLLYLGAVERSVRPRDVVGWLARASFLTVGVAAGALMVLWFQRGGVALNLATTERPAVVAARSSWSETWRGLGHWLTYFRDGGGQLRPQAAGYFRNPFVVLATYAAPLVAALTLTLSRWRPRWFYGALVAVGPVLMVGMYPPSAPSPFGAVVRWGVENTLFLRGFRTTYKAGALLLIGISILAGYGIAKLRPVLGAVVVGLLGVAAFPFWTGNLYNADDGFEEIPDYWDDALTWLNDQPEDGRVLVLPGVLRTRYRWGYVNDNLFHGLLDKPLVAHQSIPPPGTPLAADAILALDEHLVSPGYRAGTAAPILERLGVRWVLFQNDVDWQRAGLPRPSVFDPLRDDPDLVAVASFGASGQNVTAAADPLPALTGESQLAPVEIFELRDPVDPVRVEAHPPVVVAGAGDAWPQLAQQGTLDTGPILYPAEVSPDRLRAALADGASVVVTDGARRRYLQVTTGRIAVSHTLALDEETPRPVRSPFEAVTSTTYATYPDAWTIEASRTGRGVTPFDPSQRPALAFDGVERTAWQVAGNGSEGATVVARLRGQHDIRSARILPFVGAPDRAVESVVLEVVTADGDIVRTLGTVDSDAPSDPWVDLTVVADDAVEVRIRLADLGGNPNVAAGLAEVRLDGPDGPLDLREFLQTPEDLRSFAPQLDRVPLQYSFRRHIGTGAGDEETELRRRFWSPSLPRVEMEGTVRLTDRTPEATVDALLRGQAPAGASARALLLPGGWGANAADGDLATSWFAPPEEGQTLTVRPPKRKVSSIEIVTTVSAETPLGTEPFSELHAATITASAGADDATVRLHRSEPRCLPEVAAGICVVELEGDLPPAVYDSIQIELRSIAATAGHLGLRPVAVSEVTFDSTPVDPERSRNRTGACMPGFLLDGSPIDVRLDPASRDQLLLGEPVRFTSCESFAVEPGDHTFESVSSWSGAISELRLVDQRTPAPAATDATDAAAVEVVERSPSRLVLDVTAPEGAHLLGPGAHHAGWTARVDGTPIGAAIPLDATSAWRVPRLDGTRVELVFRPQRTYELALGLTAAMVAVCLYLVTRARGR